MPIWGVCLGFEMLTSIGANGANPRTECDTYDRSLPVLPATEETGNNGVNPRTECDTYDRSLPVTPATEETGNNQYSTK